MSDLFKNINQDEVNKAKVDRESSMNPKEFAPGMEDNMDDFFSDEGFDFFGGDSKGAGQTDFNTSGSDSFGGFGGNGFDGNGFGGNGFGGNGFGQQQQVQKKKFDFEDAVSEGTVVAAKGVWAFMKVFAKSFKGLKPRFWTKFGSISLICSGVYLLLSLVSLLLFRDYSTQLFIATILTAITGIGCLTFLYDKAKEDLEEYATTVDTQSDQTTSDMSDDDFEGFGGFGDDEDTEEELDGFDSFDDNTEEEEEDVGFNFDMSKYSEPEKEPVSKSPEDIINSINVDKGVYTRQFIYDNFMAVLDNIERDYSKSVDILESDPKFDMLNYMVVSAAKMQMTGKSTDDLPYLISAKENKLFIRMDIKRVKGLSNMSNFCKEIEMMFKFDEDTASIPEDKQGIYATSTEVNDKIVIKVYKKEQFMVSIKDIMEKNKDFFLDMSNKIPCVLGIDQDGLAVVKDLKVFESSLITGMPRGGKTWFVLMMLYQMAMWNNPDDLWFYIIDPKGKMSDFKSMNIPHVKEFVTDEQKILQILRQLVNVEAKRREGIIGHTSKVNIWDFKKTNPDVKLPIIYVVMDEVISIADKLKADPEMYKEFQRCLRELVSRLPAFGIRIIMVPHILKNDIIGKTTTDLIPFRVSVKGDSEHIAHNLGVKNFKYVLSNVGDTAVKLPDAEDCKFVKSAVLSKSNERNKELFEFMRKFWLKINPNYAQGSICEFAEQDEEINKLITSDDEEIDLFDDDDLI